MCATAAATGFSFHLFTPLYRLGKYWPSPSTSSSLCLSCRSSPSPLPFPQCLTLVPQHQLLRFTQSLICPSRSCWQLFAAVFTLAPEHPPTAPNVADPFSGFLAKVWTSKRKYRRRDPNALSFPNGTFWLLLLSSPLWLVAQLVFQWSSRLFIPAKNGCLFWLSSRWNEIVMAVEMRGGCGGMCAAMVMFEPTNWLTQMDEFKNPLLPVSACLSIHLHSSMSPVINHLRL